MSPGSAPPHRNVCKSSVFIRWGYKKSERQHIKGFKYSGQIQAQPLSKGNAMAGIGCLHHLSLPGLKPGATQPWAIESWAIKHDANKFNESYLT